MLTVPPITQPLINNFYCEIPATSSPLKIEADLPICVAQYVTSQGACGNGTQVILKSYPEPGGAEYCPGYLERYTKFQYTESLL